MSCIDLYVQYKTIFKFEKYLVQLPPLSRIAFCRFRLNNTRLPIVLGRFTKPKTPRNLRLCTLCSNEELGNELHFLLKCNHPQIISLRSNYIPSAFTDQPSMQKCVELLGTENLALTRKVAMFIKNGHKLLR